jgi:hypothetical protein
MRSKVAKRILAETPDSVKQKVEEYVKSLLINIDKDESRNQI